MNHPCKGERSPWNPPMPPYAKKARPFLLGCSYTPPSWAADRLPFHTYPKRFTQSCFPSSPWYHCLWHLTESLTKFTFSSVNSCSFSSQTFIFQFHLYLLTILHKHVHHLLLRLLFGCCFLLAWTCWGSPCCYLGCEALVNIKHTSCWIILHLMLKCHTAKYDDCKK